MRYIFLVLTFIVFSFQLHAQVLVINELDCDTPGIDDKEFLELRSFSPNFALDGYVVVFFNGSTSGGNTSYLALDLDGYVTDVNGIFLIGSTKVTPFPQYIIPENVIQNGADAVAIYKANDIDFPVGTVAYVDTKLIDVLLYDTNDPDALSMIEIFKAFNPNIEQISEGPTNNTNSIQRNNDGSYFVGVPTPRKPNDGSGVILNGLLTSVAKTSFDEGETFNIVFMTEEAVETDLNIIFSLNNGFFNNADYTGNTNVTILKGSKTTSTSITLVDDTLDEGDEIMIIKLSPLPSNFLPLNNNSVIRIIDNDFKVANFGTPLQPTYGRVSNTKPIDYYTPILGKSGVALKTTLTTIIANPATVRAQTYNDVVDILKKADQSPLNSNKIWLVYLEKERSKLDFQLSSDNVNTWNREHTWPRSRGGFFSIEADETIDGKDIFWKTHADSLRHGNSDAHALRAADGPENSLRNNKFYGQYTGPAGTLGKFRGDVARSVFFMDLRYNGLDLVNGYPEGQVGKFGDLATLLEWHRNDPPDDFEMNRNNIVYEWQRNRNPFIDMPDLVEYIFGNKKDQTWNGVSSVDDKSYMRYNIYPNPMKDGLKIDGLSKSTKVDLISLDGKLLETRMTDQNQMIHFSQPTGMYLLQFVVDQKTYTHKLVIE